MSITVKRLLLNYSQEKDKKVIYYRFENNKIKYLTKQEADKATYGYTKKTFIFDEEIEPNTVIFFNKIPLLENSNRVYLIFFNTDICEVRLNNAENEYTLEELSLLIKEKIYKENKKFEQFKRQVELYEKFSSSSDSNRREPIPEDVKFEVWRRDGGKCVICGSQKNLEFDHIIPFSKGGSSTARNIQLLCQDCNRRKSNQI